MARHGTYSRKDPPGARVARWYCRKAPQTFSLLPECLSARLPGTLAQLEAVVRVVEDAASVESAADVLRPDVELPGALRWTRRRVQMVHRTLRVLRGLLPEQFAACPLTVRGFARRMGAEPVLPALRVMALDVLEHLPAPLGFRPRLMRGGEASSLFQHQMGPDPPALAR